MSKTISGNKGFFLKALSIGLSALTLSQFSVGAVNNKTDNGKPLAQSKASSQREKRVRRKVRTPGKSKNLKQKGTSNVIDCVKKVIKNHPVAAGVTGVVATSPAWGYGLYKLGDWAYMEYGPITGKTLNYRLENCWNKKVLNLSEIKNRLEQVSIFLGEDNAPERTRLIDENPQSIEAEIDRLREVLEQRIDTCGDSNLQSALIDVDNNLLAIKFGFHKNEIQLSEGRLQNLRFDTSDGGRGDTYVDNMITRTEVTASNDRIAEMFRELGLISGYTAGIDCGADNNSGWEMSAYEYYFADRHHYQGMNYSKQQRFAKIVTLLHDHRNDPKWRDLIDSAMVVFSTHGNHCDWRATALTDQVYILLKSLILQRGLDDNAVQIHSDLDVMFSDLKDEFLDKARTYYLDHIIPSDVHEPLSELNAFTDYMAYCLNMIRNDPGCQWYSRIRARGPEVLDLFTSKEKLFRVANKVMIDRYHDERALTRLDNNLFRNICEREMNFRTYCDTVGKTREDMERFVEAIQGSGNDELQSWALGNSELTLGGIYESISTNITNADRKGCPEIACWHGVKLVLLLQDQGYFAVRK